MLSQPFIDQLFASAGVCAPREMCGFLFAKDRFWWTVNVADDPLHGFQIAHEDYLKACMAMDEKPLAIVHSHPTKSARPSVKDCQLMDELVKCGQPLLMLIVGLEPKEIRVYQKHRHVYECRYAYVQPNAEER